MLDELEEKWIQSIPAEYKIKMKENQKKLMIRKKEKTTLQKSPNPSAKKKKDKGKLPQIGKPDPFTALEILNNAPKKKKTTPKDTRRPRSQFMEGRHMGPKVK